MSKQSKKGQAPIIAIDGEGFDRGSVYAYMAASTERAMVSTLENLRGIRTEQALDFLLELPKEALKVGFSLGYDYTHILKDVDDLTLWKLNDPQRRLGLRGGPQPVSWDHGGNRYMLNLLSGRFSVMMTSPGEHAKSCQDMFDCPGCKVLGRAVVWDFFKFFQSSFVSACMSWGVLTQDEFEYLSRMKLARAGFQRPKSETDPEWLEVKRYCGVECVRMATLAKKLIDAHNDGGINLRTYYGAGSSGAGMLDLLKARDYCRIKEGKEYRPLEKYHPHLVHALACAFFGGRFEISRRGLVTEPCWSYDISSAYPYAFTFLPCMVHGKWEWRPDVKLGDIERADMAVVNYSLPWVESLGKIKDEACERKWGPFPFRNDEGNIIFPVTSGGGWLHKDEFLAGASKFPNVRMHGAWVYNTGCSCEVFRTAMPKFYRLRLSWGKEGRGIVLKLGMNSCYGKAAQTKGRTPPYQCIPWAGAITANCRAQVLRELTDDTLMIATDGIVSTKRLTPERPRDTETFDLKKPLGGWEEKELPNGLFLIRPGIAFPLGTLEEKETKARGIGKTILSKLRETVLENYRTKGIEPFEITRPMFWGMKSQLRESGGHIVRGKDYGMFKDQVVKVDYHPAPKRPCVGENDTLMTWALGPTVSNPYKPLLGGDRVVSKHVELLQAEKRMLEDQPDMIGDEWEEGL